MAAVSFALLMIRIACSLAFLYHGSGILFGAWGGPGVQRFAASEHLPVFVAFLVGVAQVCGGLAVLTGVFTRVGAACMIVVMLGAIFLVHWPHGFDISKGGFEYALTQLLIGVALLASGPGDYSFGPRLPRAFRRL